MQSTPENSGPFQKIISLLKGGKKQPPVQTVEIISSQSPQVPMQETRIPDYLKVSNTPKVPIAPDALWGNSANNSVEQKRSK